MLRNIPNAVKSFSLLMLNRFKFQILYDNHEKNNRKRNPLISLTHEVGVPLIKFVGKQLNPINPR